jgi:hypothetical protein
MALTPTSNACGATTELPAPWGIHLDVIRYSSLCRRWRGRLLVESGCRPKRGGCDRKRLLVRQLASASLRVCSCRAQPGCRRREVAGTIACRRQKGPGFAETNRSLEIRSACGLDVHIKRLILPSRNVLLTKVQVDIVTVNQYCKLLPD